MAKIFISYSRKDETFARKLATALSNASIDVWIDVDDIPAGMKWHQAIAEGLELCDVMLLILSPDSMDSKNVDDEWSSFHGDEKPIIPILWRNARVHFQLRRYQYVDFEKQSFDVAFKELKPELQRYIDVPQETTHPQIIESLPRKKSQKLLSIPIIATIVIVTLIILISTRGLGLFSGENSTETPQSSPDSTEIVQLATEAPTLTATLTVTPEATLTPSETLEIALVVGTLDAEATIAQATVDANSTASARATEFAVGTQSIIDQTATATQWTDTPTPNVTASIEAFRTQRAETETQTWIDSWTATPSNTPTSTPNATATLIAFRPQQNSDWTPIEREFDGVTMVLVPTGCFTIGSDDGDSDELNGNEICFDDPFWIDRTEVTQSQYQECVDNSMCSEVPASDYSSYPNQPVNRVNWFQADMYCEWRYGDEIGHLPTEAEWEFAARGLDGLVYPWGNGYIAGNVIGEDDSIFGDVSTAPVASRPSGVSWVGAMDMSGNVWEWTSSLYADYPYDATDGREDDTTNRTDVLYILRGGSFFYASYFLRSAFRDGRTPDLEYNNSGFRCARSFEE